MPCTLAASKVRRNQSSKHGFFAACRGCAALLLQAGERLKRDWYCSVTLNPMAAGQEGFVCGSRAMRLQELVGNGRDAVVCNNAESRVQIRFFLVPTTGSRQTAPVNQPSLGQALAIRRPTRFSPYNNRRQDAHEWLQRNSGKKHAKCPAGRRSAFAKRGFFPLQQPVRPAAGGPEVRRRGGRRGEGAGPAVP